MIDDRQDNIDWRLTTWEGAQLEQLRRWAALPLEEIILAIEEMGDWMESGLDHPDVDRPHTPHNS